MRLDLQHGNQAGLAGLCLGVPAQSARDLA
jgi:hypothetical protein